jgi:UDP-N-acetylglucosamine 2-epimerase
MSESFFKDMNIPEPKWNLNIHESSHGKQIGEMIIKLEQYLIKEKPNVTIVFGDTNSTFAGAVASTRLGIPVAHIEAGCRSYDISMPEEQNRIMVDHISKMLFSPTNSAARILQSECVYGDIYNYGDVSVDIINSTNIKPLSPNFILSTIHRPSNADSKITMENILSALNKLDDTVIFPVHPRTNKILEKYKLKDKYSNIHYVDPMNYSTMISHIKSAKMIVTDSGGIQKESYILRTPCITLRNTTEWIETTQLGWNVIVPSLTKKDILNTINNYKTPSVYMECFGSVGVSKRIIDTIGDRLNENITN